MANTIKLKRGTSTPSTSDIDSGEVAIDTSAQKLYINDSGTVKEIGGGGSSIGGNTGVDFNDNVKARFGTGDDTELYFDGTNTYLKNTPASSFYIQSGGNLLLENTNGENYVKGIANGGVELYYNNVKTFETEGSGIIVKGPEGGSAFVYMYADEGDDNADKYWLKTEQDGTGFLIQNYVSGSTETNLRAVGNGGVELYYDNIKTFETTGGGAIIRGTEGGDANLFFYADEGDDNADQWRLQAHSDGSFKLFNYADAANELNIEANGGGNVELYFDNSKKMESTSNGIAVTGRLDISSYINIQNGADLYLADNGKANFGDSTDLEIFHDGSASYIRDDGTGDLMIESNSAIRFRDNTGGVDFAKMTNGGGVELYYDNSKKLQTNSTGIQPFGNVDIQSAGDLLLEDNGDLKIGNGQDVVIWHNGSSSGFDNKTGHLYIRGNSGGDVGGNIYIQALSGEDSIKLIHNAHVSLYYDNSQKFYTQSNKCVVAGHLYPEADYTYNLGHESYKWHTVFSKNTAKAYGNFNQTNHGARLNFNIQSYTDYGTGQTRVTFSTALANNSYIVCTGGSRDQPESSRCYPSNIDGMATTHFDITNHNDGSTNVDWTLMMFTVFGT